MIGIYGFKNKLNNKWYIGQSRNVEARIKYGHINNTKDKDINSFDYILHNVGIENFEIHYLIECKLEDLNFWERHFVEKYDSYKNGYNRTEGGQQWPKTYKITESHRAALKASWTDERRKRYHEKLCKAQQTFRQSEAGKLATKKQADKIRGRKMSEEFCIKQSERKMGHITTEETKLKISKSNKGRKHTDISKKHMSEAHKGKSPGNKGKKFVWNDPLDRSKGFHYIDKNTENEDE